MSEVPFRIRKNRQQRLLGARAATPYGRIQAFRYAKYLSEAGVQVISGMAYGIDTEAHRGALEGRGGTWAVLGNGPDICYPAGNRGLYQRILRTGGGIISEQNTGNEGPKLLLSGSESNYKWSG